MVFEVNSRKEVEGPQDVAKAVLSTLSDCYRLAHGGSVSLDFSSEIQRSEATRSIVSVNADVHVLAPRATCFGMTYSLVFQNDERNEIYEVPSDALGQVRNSIFNRIGLEGTKGRNSNQWVYDLSDIPEGYDPSVLLKVLEDSKGLLVA